MTAALRSTLAALVHEPAAVRRLGLWGIVAALFPVGIGLQAMSLPADAGAPRVSLSQPRTAGLPGLSLAAFTKPIADAADQVQLTFSTADFVRAKPFLFAGSLAAREQSVACLAAAAWYEAGNDLESQRSVIQVVLNRVSHPSFPKTICGVVMQGSERSTGCQFTFTCDGSLYRRRPGAASWAAARSIFR